MFWKDQSEKQCVSPAVFKIEMAAVGERWEELTPTQVTDEATGLVVYCSDHISHLSIFDMI